MNLQEPAPAKRRFQLFRGFGAQAKKEADQLDRFLTTDDSALLASFLREETPPARPPRLSRERRMGLTVFLVLAAAVPTGWLASRRAAVPDPEEGWELVAEARQQAVEARYTEALETALEATRVAPRLVEAWVTLGDCQMKSYQSALSEKAFRQALALDPESTKALTGLGALYMRRGEEHKAEQMWLRGGADMKLAGLYLLQGRYHEAEIRLRPLIARGTEDELLYRMATAARSRLVEPGLRSLLEPEPTGRSEWADLGWRLYRQERNEEAEQAFRSAIAKVPRDVNALSGLGLSLLALDRTNDAKLYFDRALALDPDHGLSLNGKALCLKNEGRTGEALAIWQTMARLYPGINYGTSGLAWTYFELGNYSQAAVYLDQLVRRYPSDLRAVDALNTAVQHLGPAQPN